MQTGRINRAISVGEAEHQCGVERDMFLPSRSLNGITLCHGSLTAMGVRTVIRKSIVNDFKLMISFVGKL